MAAAVPDEEGGALVADAGAPAAEAEQASVLLSKAPESSAGPKKQRRIALAGLLALGAICAVGSVLCRREAQALEEELSGLSRRVQDRFLVRHNRLLTREELQIVLDRAAWSLPRAGRGRALLSEVWVEQQERRVEGSGLSARCKTALEGQVVQQLQSCAGLMVEMAWACVVGEGGADCKAAEQRLEAFEEELKKECRANGDLCARVDMKTAASVGQMELLQASECVPSACFDEAEEVVRILRTVAAAEDDEDNEDDVEAVVRGEEEEKEDEKEEMEKKGWGQNKEKMEEEKKPSALIACL